MTFVNEDIGRHDETRVLGCLWWLPLLRGILLLILGAYALLHPGMSMLILTQVVAVFIILDGILAIVAALMGKTPSRGWTIFRGAIAILAGVFVFGHPLLVAGITSTFVLYVIALFAIAVGAVEIIAAIRDRKEIQGEGWLILSGLLTVLFGFLVLIAPMAFGLMFVRILGAFAMFGGISLIVLAFRLRSFLRIWTQQIDAG